jgi:hypothetical protein
MKAFIDEFCPADDAAESRAKTLELEKKNLALEKNVSYLEGQQLGVLQALGVFRGANANHAIEAAPQNPTFEEVV